MFPFSFHANIPSHMVGNVSLFSSKGVMIFLYVAKIWTLISFLHIPILTPLFPLWTTCK
jgi:hypothetical protein